MKKIFLIRHAKSSWKNPGLNDIDRPLNQRGLNDAPLMAALLHKKTGGEIDALISSPANRARTTAAFFAQQFGCTVQIEDSIYEAWESDLLDLIKSLDNKLNAVAIFGHNPTFTSLANKFSSTPIDNVPTCGIVQIETTVEDWNEFSILSGQVAAFYYPKLFKD